MNRINGLLKYPLFGKLESSKQENFKHKLQNPKTLPSLELKNHEVSIETQQVRKNLPHQIDAKTST